MFQLNKSFKFFTVSEIFSVSFPSFSKIVKIFPFSDSLQRAFWISSFISAKFPDFSISL